METSGERVWEEDWEEVGRRMSRMKNGTHLFFDEVKIVEKKPTWSSLTPIRKKALGHTCSSHNHDLQRVFCINVARSSWEKRREGPSVGLGVGRAESVPSGRPQSLQVGDKRRKVFAL